MRALVNPKEASKICQYGIFHSLAMIWPISVKSTPLASAREMGAPNFVEESDRSMNRGDKYNLMTYLTTNIDSVPDVANA